jgi:hypothetical protein
MVLEESPPTITGSGGRADGDVDRAITLRAAEQDVAFTPLFSNVAADGREIDRGQSETASTGMSRGSGPRSSMTFLIARCTLR